MKQKIHINDQGELLLIEVTDTPKSPSALAPLVVWEYYDKVSFPSYQAALTSAIEKGIKFRDQEATKWLLINEFNGKENMRGWFQPGKSFDLPNSYTAQVKWYNPCIEHKKCLIADDQNRNNCAQLHGNKCQKEYRVAVLTPLKQEHGIAYEVKTGSSYDNFRVLTEAEKEELLKPGNGEGFRIKILGQSEGRLFVNGEEYVKKQSGEPATAEKISAGNEAKKEDDYEVLAKTLHGRIRGTDQEYIICAAVHFETNSICAHQPSNITHGFVVCGRRHHNCFTSIFIIGSKRFKEIEQGFVTSKDRFVNRKEAGEIAFKAGQTKELRTCLFSEDLY